MIPAWFTAQMARMADLREAPSSLIRWWEDLKDMPEEVLEAAVTHAWRTRVFFPVPAQLREDADVAYRAPVGPQEPPTRELAEPVVLGTLPTGTPIVARLEAVYHCPDCGDSGLVGWVDDERRLWKRRCRCWADNPVLVSRRAAQARYASGRTR